MTKGSEVQGVIEQNVPPLFSRKTLMVCAALAAGFRFACDKPFVDVTEVKADGTPLREVRWVFQVAEPIEFQLGNGRREKLGFAEFMGRLEDEAWCDAHAAEHPVALLGRTLRLIEGYQHKLRAKEEHPVFGKPLIRHVRLRRGKQWVVIPANLTPEQQAEELTKLGWKS